MALQTSFSKSEIAAYFRVSRTTLNKWAKRVRLNEQIENYEKRRVLDGREFELIKQALGAA